MLTFTFTSTHSETLKEAVPLLESFPGALARTERKLAEILATDHEAAQWILQARQHYCQAVGAREETVEDWSGIDFDALVPVIDR